MKKYVTPEVELLSFATTDMMNEGSDENETFLDNLGGIFRIDPPSVSG